MPAGPRNLAAFLAPLAAPLPTAVGSVRARPPAGADDGEPALAVVLARTHGAGHGPRVVAALERAWPTLTPRERRQVASPLRPGPDGVLRLGRDPARQTSETTCGSASLILLAAAGDPVLATWLVTGRTLGVRPAAGVLPDVAWGVGPGPGPGPAQGVGEGVPASAGERFAALQAAMLRATSRRAVGPLPWPSRFGTPPWTAARQARFPGVRYGHRPVDDADAAAMARLLTWVRSAVGRGVPVPLYTGGDARHGLGTAIPRHVILAVPPPRPVGEAATGAAGAGVSLYEPGTARVYSVSDADLIARTTPLDAFGRWAHLCWAVLPQAAPRLP